MLEEKRTVERIPCYCALCISRCGSIAVVEDGRFVALEPDPSHPTGKAICAKGRAAPELVYGPDRLLDPAFLEGAGEHADGVVATCAFDPGGGGDRCGAAFWQGV